MSKYDPLGKSHKSWDLVRVFSAFWAVCCQELPDLSYKQNMFIYIYVNIYLHTYSDNYETNMNIMSVYVNTNALDIHDLQIQPEP